MTWPDDGPPASGISETLASYVAEVRMPDHLLDQAAAGYRARTRRNRLIVSMGAAVAVAAVAAVVVIGVGRAAPAGRPAAPASRPAAAANPTAPVETENAAYILQHVAVAQVNSYQLISMSQASNGIMYTDVSTQQRRYIAPNRASDGQPFFEWADTIKDGTWTDLTIVNQQRVWSVQSASTSDHGPFGAYGLTISSFLPLQTSPDPAAAFNSALKQGTIVVVGHRNLNGRDTILIRVKPPLQCGKGAAPLPSKLFPHIPPGVKPPKCVNGYFAGYQVPPADELWVDASTYLLVQTKTFVESSSWDAPKKTWKPFVTQVTWLPPTPENLAKLTITPPPGYAKVPYTDLAKYLGPIS
jgi:hypothetical protein